MEGKKERLIGSTSVLSRSSDESIARDLRGLVSQIQATSENILEGQTLKPTLVDRKRTLESSPKHIDNQVIGQKSSLDYKSSAFALKISQKRNSKLKV